MASATQKYILDKKGREMLEPLLEATGYDSDESTETTEAEEPKHEVEKRSALQKLKTSAVYCVLGAGVAISAAACVVAPATLVFVAAGICVANVPYSAYKEHYLSKIPTLRSLNNALRAESKRLMEQVDILSEEINVLEPEADRAAAVEGELRQIADQQHVNVDKLVDLVRENGAIIEKMKENLRERIAQDIIRIVLSSDKDGNDSFNKVEAKMLALKIRIQLQEYNVDLDEDKFYNVICMNPTVPRIISIIQKIFPHMMESNANESEDETDADNDDSADLSEVFYFTNNLHPNSDRRESLVSSPSQRKVNSSRSLSRIAL